MPDYNNPASKNFVPQRTNIIESFYNSISKKVSPIFINFNFSANSVTIISGLFGISGSLLITFNNNIYNILAFLFLNIFVILDLVDGDIARHTKTTSLFGRWLDLFFDKLNEVMLISCLSYTGYMITGKVMTLYIGFFLLAMHYSYQFLMISNLYWFDKNKERSNLISNTSKKKKNHSLYFLKPKYFMMHFTLKHSTLFFISSLFILIGRPDYSIVVLAFVASYSVILTCVWNFIRLKNL